MRRNTEFLNILGSISRFGRTDEYWLMLNTDRSIDQLFIRGCSRQDVEQLVWMSYQAANQYQLIHNLFLYACTKYLEQGYSIDDVVYRLVREGIDANYGIVIELNPQPAIDEIVYFK